MVTFTVPAGCAGVTTVTRLELLKLTEVALLPPKDTESPLTKLLPEIVISVPPALGPLVGVRLTMIGGGGGGVKVKALEAVADCRSGFWTVTSTTPAACAGVTAVTNVELLKFTETELLVPKVI